MPALPGFKQFETDVTEKYDGILPYDTPLSSFQVAHDIIWEFRNIDVTGGISAGTGTGTFEYKLLRPTDDAVLFWQAITLTFTYVCLSFGGFLSGGLDFFTWSFTKEKIDTFVVNGQPTDKHPTTPDPQNPAYRYTIGGTEFSEFGTAIPGGGPASGNGVGVFGGIIESFYQGPLYSRNVSLPARAGLDIVRDQWQAKIARLPLWHVRAVAGVSEMDAVLHDFGFIIKAYNVGDDAFFALTHANGAQEPRGKIGTGTQPAIETDNAGTVYGHLLETAGVGVYESVNTGQTWKRARVYKDETTTEEEDLYAWESGFNMPRLIRLSDGARATIALKNGFVYYKTSRDNFKGLIVVGEAKTAEDYELCQTEDGLLYVEAAGRRAFYSETGGAIWKRFYYPGEPEDAPDPAGQT